MSSEHLCTRLPVVLFCATALLAGCGGEPPTSEGPSLVRWGTDLLGGGSTLVLEDSISGDVMVAGGEITFSGASGGDFIGAGGEIEVGGRVGGSVRAAGGEIRLSGQVARNVTAAGGRVELAQGAVIEGNAYLAGGNVQVGGEIGGFLRVAGREVELNGPVAGSVEVRGGSLRLGPTAVIEGDLNYVVEAEDVVIDPAARIAGSVTGRPAPPQPPVGLFRVVLMIGFLVAGAVGVAVFPRTAAAAEAALRERPGASLGLGLAWVLFVPIVIAAIGMTIIGLPLAFILFALYLISLYLGRAVVALWLGRLLLRRWTQLGRGRLVSAFLVGGVVCLLVWLIPWAGPILLILATLFGLGALALALMPPRAPQA